MDTPPAKRSWFAVLLIALLAGGAGVWLGVTITEHSISQRKPETTPDIEQDAKLRADVIGMWIEEEPIKLSTVPLLASAVLELRPDGTFREKSRLLTPHREPLKQMAWFTTGRWRIRAGFNLVLEITTSTGPTTRPTGVYEYFAFVSGDELMMGTSNSPDRGEESHTYRRMLAKRLTEADLEGAREEQRDAIPEPDEPPDYDYP